VARGAAKHSIEKKLKQDEENPFAPGGGAVGEPAALRRAARCRACSHECDASLMRPPCKSQRFLLHFAPARYIIQINITEGEYL